RCLSDWSSDVCSSDLVDDAGAYLESHPGVRLRRDGNVKRHQRRLQVGRQVERAFIEVPDLPGPDPLAFGTQIDGFARAAQDPLEIGRASCRERVKVSV